ncbi:MAG TPA: hypothetical protein VGG41_16025 [Solirubrobacteraceae bacterium]|jgi:hypothetical protein
MVRISRWTLAAALCLLALAPSVDASAGGGQLVYMQQVRPVTITPQNITVQNSGEAAVIVVIGETAIPKPVRFRLGSAALEHLRSLVERSRIARLHIQAPIPFSALMYTVRAEGNSVRVVEGHVPRSLRPLIAFLHELILAHY